MCTRNRVFSAQRTTEPSSNHRSGCLCKELPPNVSCDLRSEDRHWVSMDVNCGDDEFEVDVGGKEVGRAIDRRKRRC
jgi:hypothetical protein